MAKRPSGVVMRMYYPKIPSALKISHPVGGPMLPDGSEWPRDGETMRLLTEGVITPNAQECYKPPRDNPDTSSAAGSVTDRGPGAAEGQTGRSGR